EEAVELTRNLEDSLVSTNAGVALAHAHYEAGEPQLAIELLLLAAGGAELPRIPDGWRANYFELLTRCWLAVGGTEQAKQSAAHAESPARRGRLPPGDGIADSHRCGGGP